MNKRPDPGPENPLNKIPVLKGISKLSLKDRLIKERELSDLIINCLPGIFYLTDQKGKYLRWNKNFEKVSGYSGEEIEKMHPLDFFDKQDHEQMIAATRKVFKEGYNEIEMEIVARNGARLLFHLNGISVTYEGKLCLLGAGTDLSAREKALHEIRENDKKYRSLFEQASDPILVTDYDGNFTDVNGSFCKLFGYTKKELLKMNINSLVCPKQLIEKPIRNDLVMKGKHFMSERIMIRKNGTIVETEANVKKFGEDSVMAIVRDVTEIRRLQREMEKERLELQIQEQRKITRAVIKAQERERNIIGRELHDNANQLLASARMVLSTARLTPAGKKEFVDKSIRLIDATILEIRILGRKHVTPLKGFDLKEQIQSLIKIMEEGIGFKITFEYDLPDQTELLDDLKLNIYRVIQEQLNNVYKHASASRVQIKMFTADGQIHVLINDNGIGFEVGMKKSGVGIVNIINRVESFNGTVGFETKPGIGCKLEIHIPMIFKK
ncbi:MAG TPA: PAS domain S-box protein [Puia sp.]|nr:PAS domain S-box protein [Puia sp.]